MEVVTFPRPIGCGLIEKARLSTHPPHPHRPLPLLRVVLCVIPVDRLLAVLDDGHNQVVWPPPDKALVNLQRPSYCVEEACRIDDVFVFAAYRVRDFDQAVQGSEDTRVYLPTS